jgi:hypothetical protein
MHRKEITIEETANVIDDHLLDIIGNEFKFDHVKGLAEWLKNSIDAYIHNNTPASEQYVVFRFDDENTKQPTIECIDFVGMTSANIDTAFKRWGDPNASKKGKDIKTYGGHGNGGKFYMRQMFNESRILTYRNGVLNIFGFNENKKYGYASGYKHKTAKPEEAIAFAKLSDLPIPERIRIDVLRGKTGFTVIQGVGPKELRGRLKPERLMDRLKKHPQSRRILQQSVVSVVRNGNSLYGLLKPEELTPLEKFETPLVIDVPHKLEYEHGNEKYLVHLSNEKFEPGRLILHTSAEPLSRGSNLGELNRIDILGEIGVIGSYQLFELGVRNWPSAAFIYGECSLPILEDSNNDCVLNDRTKLVKNDLTDVFLNWIAGEIDGLASKIAETEKEKQKANQKKITSKYNDVLNEWKNRHMKKILSLSVGGSDGDRPGKDGGTEVGLVVTPPNNGFDFKFPKAEIAQGTTKRITLKASVPETLPLGAVINVSSNSDAIGLETREFCIESDLLKSTPDGQEVAFINIEIVGNRDGEQATLTATAGKLEASMEILVTSETKSGSKGNAFPKVLLSDHDKDPLGLSGSETLHLPPRESVVYQRPQDVPEGIYWINTASPMASNIYDKFTFDSMQWRAFLFERYVDIFVKEAIHGLEKKDFENFTADNVDTTIADVIRRIHESATIDLKDFLFDSTYVVSESDK